MCHQVVRPLSLVFGIPIRIWSRTPLPSESLNLDHGELAMKDRSSEGIRDTNFRIQALPRNLLARRCCIMADESSVYEIGECLIVPSTKMQTECDWMGSGVCYYAESARLRSLE